jgi:hypothetical protein
VTSEALGQDPLIGQAPGHRRIIEKAGSGGMGECCPLARRLTSHGRSLLLKRDSQASSLQVRVIAAACYPQVSSERGVSSGPHNGRC